jgi:hypothetical protein
MKPSPTRRAPVFAAALLVAHGCAGPPAPALPGPAGLADLRDTDAWVDLHAQFRVAGLDDRRFSPEHYWDVALPVIEATPRLRISQVGESLEGRPLREVVFGSGPTTVLLWSQMHGDESTASMTLVDLFAWLASDDPWVEELGRRTTLHFIPVLNPDGATRFQRRNAVGIDVNRDARRLATPEARTLKAVHDRVEPDFAFNLHDQNVRTRVGRTDRRAAFSLLAPAFNEARDVNPTRERAMRLAAAIAAVVEPLLGDRVTQYDDAFNPRAFGDLISAWGASAILIESGGLDGDPQKQALREANFVALGHALEVIARERWNDADTEGYSALPPNGRSIDDLLVTGGTLVLPTGTTVRMDLSLNFMRPLVGPEAGTTLRDAGDLEGYEASDTMDVGGLYLLPGPGMLDDDGVLRIGAPVGFRVSRDQAGTRIVRDLDHWSNR